MSELTPLITQAVENGAAKLLNHFKDQYWAMYFIPLWVNSKTPGKIAPMVAQAIEEQLLAIQDNQITMNVIDDKIWVVFDTFIDRFYDSLSFLWKWLMKSFDLKMNWNEYLDWLNKRKSENSNSYKTWKDNLSLVLQLVFDEIIIAINGQNKTVSVSNGEQYFWSSREAIDAMKIFA